MLLICAHVMVWPGSGEHEGQEELGSTCISGWSSTFRFDDEGMRPTQNTKGPLILLTFISLSLFHSSLFDFDHRWKDRGAELLSGKTMS